MCRYTPLYMHVTAVTLALKTLRVLSECVNTAPGYYPSLLPFYGLRVNLGYEPYAYRRSQSL